MCYGTEAHLRVPGHLSAFSQEVEGHQEANPSIAPKESISRTWRQVSFRGSSGRTPQACSLLKDLQHWQVPHVPQLVGKRKPNSQEAPPTRNVPIRGQRAWERAGICQLLRVFESH